MDELLSRSATHTAQALKDGHLSCAELTARLLDRIAAVDTKVNAIAELDADGAMRRAHAADQAIADGSPLGPLHGVPITIKDCFDAEGLHTTWGNPAFATHRATADATLVARLKQAGANVIGKTNTAFMLADVAQSANDLHGATANPWDLTRTPGGSSGGAAAALAAGLSFLDYGSDLAGSIRIPAALCGVYGLKPSTGLVSLHGFQPPGTPASTSDHRYLSAAGPLARTAGDLRVALQATAGPDGPAALAYRWHLPPPRHTRLGHFRVGFVLDDPFAPPTAEVGASLRALLDHLAAQGATLVEGWPSRLDPAASYAAFGAQLEAFFAFAEGADLAGYPAQELARHAARQAWQDHFTRVDVFVCPSSYTAAFPPGDLPHPHLPFWGAHASLAGLPSLAAPIGRTDGGLPVGAQIIAPLYEDDTVITFAELLAAGSSPATAQP
ncbi:amidase family protein [Nonomuraea sp. NPDC050556]|uniref:amidase family protein n=1 Tax=Nonomuraea sp. NPDC050556 TaxID=3364369 RepID=UPI0037BA1864